MTVLCGPQPVRSHDPSAEPGAEPYFSLASQDLANKLGSGNTEHEAGFPDLDADVRSNYIANTTIAGLEFADLILIIGSNPRIEAPVLNARCACSFAGCTH